MSTVTSDGREFVYAVFGADGCECDNLEAVFGCEEEAKHYIAGLLAGPMWTPLRGGLGDAEAADARFYGKASLLEVRVIELGKKFEVIPHGK